MNSQPSDFANKILEIINNSDELDKLKKNARELYIEQLNWQTVGLRFSEVLENIM